MSRVSGVAELVRSMILRGEIASGRRLIELHLAERLRIGRSTLREALRRIEGECLLVADPAGGMRVIRLDAGDVADTLELRMALEASSAGLAARSVHDGHVAPRALGDLQLLAEDAQAAERHGDGEAALLADRHLHRAIAALGAGRPCRDALDHVWDRLFIATANSVVAPEAVPVSGHEHFALLAAIGSGDEDDASAIARRHVRHALDPGGRPGVAARAER